MERATSNTILGESSLRPLHALCVRLSFSRGGPISGGFPSSSSFDGTLLYSAECKTGDLSYSQNYLLWPFPHCAISILLLSAGDYIILFLWMNRHPGELGDIQIIRSELCTTRSQL